MVKSEHLPTEYRNDDKYQNFTNKLCYHTYVSEFYKLLQISSFFWPLLSSFIYRGYNMRSVICIYIYLCLSIIYLYLAYDTGNGMQSKREIKVIAMNYVWEDLVQIGSGQKGSRRDFFKKMNMKCSWTP